MSSFQDKAQYQISQLDKELSKYPALKKFEDQTSVPKVYIVLGLGALYFFLIFFNIGGALLVNTAGFAIPAYYSLQALFSISPTDDTQWLTYWVLYAFLTVVETAINAVYWFPFYFTFKFVFILWMALPQTNGAQILFRSFVAPVFARYFEGDAVATVSSTATKLKTQAESATKNL